MEGDRSKDENLPPGFRFHPTDEELITYYLINKISDATFTARAVADVDLNKSEPWELPGKAKMGEKEWYFFSLRDRKYPTGVRTNRATNTGYWKTTGKDKEIFNSSVNSELVGMKKTLVFYRGRAPRGEKTNWVMHEYRIHSKSAFRSAKDEWVVCRVFQKSAGGKKYPPSQSSRTAVNHPYNLDHLAPNFFQPQMLQSLDHNSTLQFPMGRNYMSNAEIAEHTRVLRGSSSGSMNPPMQSQMNYPMGCFTISGLNLNLRGTDTPQQDLRPPMLHPPPPLLAPMNQQDLTSSMFNASHLAASYGAAAEMNNGNGPNNRLMTNMENCMDLDNYWPPY